VGKEQVSQILKLKRLSIVVLMCIILLSSLIIVDISVAGYEYEIAQPSFTHDFPDTIFFYNISEGVTSNSFSFIVELPLNHSGHHNIVPSKISLVFRFRNATDGADLSEFINAVFDNLWNSIFSLSMHKYDQINRNESGWWAPSLLTVDFNERLNVDSLIFGYRLELILINTFGEQFNGHELECQLEMNVTYSRWWFGLEINPAHQVVTYNFNLSGVGYTDIQSLEYGSPQPYFAC